ncbi:MAG: arginase family protein, partial [Candidatus Acidiferrales bacterium]
DVRRMGASAAAHAAIDRIKGNGYQFVLHLDLDVIAGFTATNYPNSDGLSLEEVREALLVFAQQKELAALEVTAYNPAKDPDGSGAKLIVDLLAEVLGARLAALKGPEAAVAAPPAAVAASASQGTGGSSSKSAAIAPEPEAELPAATAGEAWSSESLEESSDLATHSDSSDDDSGESAASEESSGSHS